MKRIIITTCFLITSILSFSQDYQFTTVEEVSCATVKSQGRTGTCWSFSTTSFLESEIMRIKHKNVDLSEMFTVRNTYPTKAWNYIMRQGKFQFSQGGLGHDVINSVANFGMVPENAYTGLKADEKILNHNKLINDLKKVVEGYVKNPKDSSPAQWKKEVNAILDAQMGKNIHQFTYEGKSYTPKSFADEMGIHPENYVTLTSFTHKPLYSKFVLNIPDNFSNGSMYNVSLDEFEKAIIHALNKGYSIELDVDVSEKTFSSKNGIAVIPAEGVNVEEALKTVQKEKVITPEYRQQEFENYNTTDDHLMHIVGLVFDQNGTPYYKVKNSWGSNGKRVKFGGYIYMSSAYMRLKAISILVHKKAIDRKLRRKLKL